MTGMDAPEPLAGFSKKNTLSPPLPPSFSNLSCRPAVPVKHQTMLCEIHVLTTCTCTFFSCKYFQLWCRHLGSSSRGLLKLKKRKCAVTHGHLPSCNVELLCIRFLLPFLANLNMAPCVVWCLGTKPTFSFRSSASCKTDSLLRRSCCLKMST